MTTLRLGDIAPDFEAETTEGKISFHKWLGDSWGVLFSHPKDFTPICTTELGFMAGRKADYDKRNAKILAVSVDSVADHKKWAKDIGETQGTAPNYPIIADTDFNVAKLYDMLPAGASGDVSKRTPVDNQTVRNVFLIDPDKKICLILIYPMSVGPQLQRDFACTRCAAVDAQAQGGYAGELVGRGCQRRRRDLRVGIRRRCREALPEGLQETEAVSADDA